MSGRPMISLLLLIFSFNVIAPGFWTKYRGVIVSGRLGCINTTGQWIPMPEAEVFLFEDNEGFWNPHDLVARTVTDKNGEFRLGGTKTETIFYPRFFIGVYAWCNGQTHGHWHGGPCADAEFIDRCTTYPRYWSTHSFEKNGEGSGTMGQSETQRFREKYRLDCTLGYKFTSGGTLPGLSCGGSLCTFNWKQWMRGPLDRCAHGRSMGPVWRTPSNHPAYIYEQPVDEKGINFADFIDNNMPEILKLKKD